MFEDIVNSLAKTDDPAQEIRTFEVSAMFAVYHELLQQLLSNEDTAMPVELRETLSTVVAMGRLIISGPKALNNVEANKIGLNKPNNYPF